MARSLLLQLALLLVTAFLFVAALEAPRRLRLGGHHVGAEAAAEAEAGLDHYWPTDETWTYDNPAAASFFLVGADDLEGWDLLPNATAAAITTPMLADTPAAEVAAAVAAAASQQGPPDTNRWIGHDNNEYEEPTYYFPGDIKPTWESVDGEIRLNGQPFHIKGINWFGVETDTR